MSHTRNISMTKIITQSLLNIDCYRHEDVAFEIDIFISSQLRMFVLFFIFYCHITSIQNNTDW